MDQLKQVAINNNTSDNTTATNTTEIVSLDRLTICFNEPNAESVQKSAGLLLDDHYVKAIPGMKVTKNQRYHVSCSIPFPTETNGPRHTLCFEAGPRHPGQASFRLDFNPSKFVPDAIFEFFGFLNNVIDADDLNFFRDGRITRCDVALDMPGLHVPDTIVWGRRFQKHAVYSDRRGNPETVYLGTPRSRRIVIYDKPNEDGHGTHLRLETRLKPRILGRELAQLPNPFAGLKLYPATFPDAAALGIPSQYIADSMRIGGVKRAGKPLDKSQRIALEKARAAASSLIPNLDTLWAAWPEVLKGYGLGKQLGAIPVQGFAVPVSAAVA
jgi:hypothetical protein